MTLLLQRRIDKWVFIIFYFLLQLKFRAIEKYGEEAEQSGFAPKEFQRNDGEVIKFSFSSGSKLIKEEVELEDIKPDLDKIKIESFDESAESSALKKDVKPIMMNALKQLENKKTKKSVRNAVLNRMLY